MLGEVRKDFAVKHYIFLFKAINKPGVRQAEFPRARVYFNIPKFSIVRFFITSVRERIISGMEQRFFGLAFFFASAMAHPLRLFQDASSPF
jgi:hypothetical protein